MGETMNLNELVDVVADAWGVPRSTVTIEVKASRAVVRSGWESAPLVEVSADGKTSTLDGWIRLAAARRLAAKAEKARASAAKLRAEAEYQDMQAQHADARARQIDPGYDDPQPAVWTHAVVSIGGEVVGHAAPAAQDGAT